ncbi:BAD_HP_G0063720.mRNA.1.CDS.1 [Saccharomyces cerevisiae]|nr:BAD_HP_G0016760.mRNA.1.CDS.1 [Saccharomyces cerevisiae]CAI4997092.1 BAD_HP_G0063720.mRNA.1.CDS.1 [Saccharomyces cerevisiae]CAI6493538.1 BAD_HP_G0016760.mRNA.1.CDS.1 [Saccharomyces cerevisiae]CAI6890357.1 BAD_HP_G0063720.mRNA.1.CDS.1 [Saccharomyces cerevisiae]
MAKRRQKKRTHAQLTPEQEQGIPKSMVIRVGQTSLANHSLNQLVKDFRQIMQPHTAIKLKERKSNKLKDFVVMCGPLGVTHLFMFTQSEKTGNVSLKIARTPQGPTVTFQVLDYSLGRDIKKFLKRPKSLNNDDVLNPPLLVLNGFSTSKRPDEDDQDVNVEKVIVSMFQNIFPPLNPARTSLNSIKRIFMINKDRETGEISMRHYFIDIREVEISRNLKRLYKAKNNLSKTVPNLHRKEDISSLILDHDLGAYTSESEIEDDAIVRVVDNQDVKAKHSQTSLSQKTPVEKKDNKEREKETEEEDVEMEEPKPSENLQPTPRKKAIKLTELGPRLTLKLVKIEEGICSGKVLHHEFVQKSSEEIKALEKRHAAKMRLKEQRKKEQEENIAKKKAVKDAKKQRKLERRKARAAEGGEGQGKDDAMSDDESSSSDSEHYGSVPEDLDSDLFSEVE